MQKEGIRDLELLSSNYAFQKYTEFSEKVIEDLLSPLTADNLTKIYDLEKYDKYTKNSLIYYFDQLRDFLYV